MPAEAAPGSVISLNVIDVLASTFPLLSTCNVVFSDATAVPSKTRSPTRIP